MSLIYNFIDLFLESAPWMLLGLVIAGLLKEWIPTNLLTKHLGGKGAKTTIKAAFIGAPLPLCSCGVIPAALGLRRSGASKSATTSFLVATPETGIDSVSISYALLGPFMAIIRPIAAISSAIVAGLLVGKEAEKEQKIEMKSFAPVSCCSGKKATPQANTQSSCCSSKKETKADKSAMEKLKSGIHFAATDLVKDISTWLMIGLFFASLVQTYVETDFLAQSGGSIWSMLVMVAISVPMYICATASTPIAAGLLMSGISPGAVLVFMLAGPATNIATLGVVSKELGRRSLIAYLTGVVGMAIVFGLLTDFLVAQFGFNVAPLSAMEHELLPHWLTVSTGILLAVLMLVSYWKQWRNRTVKVSLAS
ncbi:SO_0444 family Cu/Zn efflux transporter [Vibrio breoganii]